MRNLVIAVLWSAVVLMSFEYYMYKKMPQDQQPQVNEVSEMIEPLSASEEQLMVEKEVLKKTNAEKIQFKTENLVGEISTQGGVAHHISLTHFHTSKKDDTPMELLGTEPFEHLLSIQYESGGLDTPSADTVWTLQDKGDLTEKSPMVLGYKNSTGQTFTRELYMKEYVLNVEDTIVNGADIPVSIQFVGKIMRQGGQKEGEKSSFYNYFGPEGMVKGDLIKQKYEKLDKGEDFSVSGTSGFWGFSEQYFATMMLVNEQSERSFTKEGDIYVATVKKPVEFISSKSGATFKTRFYVGPKNQKSLTAAGNNLAVLVDYGWFSFIAKPMFKIMTFFHSFLGNWGFAIIALTLLLKVLTYPLAAKSYKSMAKLRKLQPEIKALQEKYKDQGRESMAAEMMALYKKNKVNPMSGCWPMFIQIPIFFAMYKTVLLTFELRGAPFVLWVQDLSIADPYFVLPILMGISMLIQMRLSPQAGDPIQAKVMQFMPFVFTALFLFFPSGLVLYWLTNNVISVAQQWWFLRQADA